VALQGGLCRALLGRDVLPPLLPRKQWLQFTAAEDLLWTKKIKKKKKIDFQTAAASSFLGTTMLICLVVPDFLAEFQLDLRCEFSDAFGYLSNSFLNI